MQSFSPTYMLAYRDYQNHRHPATWTFRSVGTWPYCGGRLFGNQDRLGSYGKYFPYGEDRSAYNPPNDSVKFATYTRDSATGLDYADQRYYASTYCRVAVPQQYCARGGPRRAQCWD